MEDNVFGKTKLQLMHLMILSSPSNLVFEYPSISPVSLSNFKQLSQPINYFWAGLTLCKRTVTRKHFKAKATGGIKIPISLVSCI